MLHLYLRGAWQRSPWLKGIVALGLATLLLAPSAAKASAAQSERPTLAQLESELAISAAIKDAPPLNSLIPPLSTNPAAVTLSPMPSACYGSWPVSARQPIPEDAATKCAWGDKVAKRSIFLIGDSQAAMWLPAFNALGQDLGWKILFLGKPSCAPWISTSAYNNDGSNVSSNAACKEFVHNEIKFVNSVHPNVVIPIGLDIPTKTNVVTPSDQESAVLKTLKALKPSGAKVLLLAGFSYVLTYDGVPTSQDCLTIHSTDLPACEVIPSQAETYPAVSGVESAAVADNIDVVPTLKLFCAKGLCPIFVKAPSGDHLIYFDAFHMINQYSTWISRALENLIQHDLPVTK
jgi:hypothetical protein